MDETETEESKVKVEGKAFLVAALPLFIINALTVYGQMAYAYYHVAPANFNQASRVVLAIMFGIATESVALYVQWHAHDALMLKSHATARQLRRASYLIALGVAAMNYSHFAEDLTPTAAACAFGLLSLLSPWMWGLHTRRMYRVQLLKERRVDDAGAEFSTTRKRMFPVRTWMAYRWSIDQNETDPVRAWDGYKLQRAMDEDAKAMRREAKKRPVGVPVDAQPVDEPVDVSIPSTRPRPSAKRAAWDVEKAVGLIQDGRTPAEILQAVDGLSAKPLQLLRRCVRFLSDGLDVDATAARVPCSMEHVQRVKAAMA